MAFASAVSLTPIRLEPFAGISIATLAAADGTNGNRFVANRNTILRVKNASVAQITVTVHTNRIINGITLGSDTFTVAATTGDVLYTGFNDVFHQNEADEVWVEFSDVTTVTVAVYQP